MGNTLEASPGSTVPDLDTTITSLTQDLRSIARSAQKLQHRKPKYCPGGPALPGHRCNHTELFEPSCEECTTRPRAYGYSRGYTNMKRHLQRKHSRNSYRMKKSELEGQLNEIEGLLRDFQYPAICPGCRCVLFPASEVIINDSGEVCELHEGGWVLHDAVSQALEQYKDREIENLVRNEYDLVSGDDTWLQGIIDDEHDFELIEAAEM